MARDSEYILTLLQEYGMVSAENAASARREAEETGGDADAIDILKSHRLLKEDELLAMLAQTYGMDMLDLRSYEIPEEVIAALPAEVVLQYNVVPVMKRDDVLTIAISDPTDMETLDAIRYFLGIDVDTVAAPAEQIEEVIHKRYHAGEDSVEGVLEGLQGEEGLVVSGGENTSAIGEAESLDDDSTPIIRLVTQLIIDAYRMKASDIHLEPMEKRYRIRYRVDGAMREVEAPPKYLQGNFTSRVKIMARLDITEKRIPQDGRIQVSVGTQAIDLRVSSVPTAHGESIVMRILDKSSIQLDIPKLGFYADDLAMVNEIISMPDGIFLVTGPTGSGKTTSLYAFLNTINTVGRKIITVEDPVEYQLSGINQVQVEKVIGFTFGIALRSMLRQAPNIIMVGEIRDLEVAEIAINAALTGHLVFSTLHTNDAPSAITRLVDIGIKPFLVATALRAVMAQRLLRRVCSVCKQPHTPTKSEIHLLGLTEEYLANHQFYQGVGCERCGHTGYKGRIGIYEIFCVTEAMSKLIFANAPSGAIRDMARRDGMRSLRDDAIRKAEAGVSTLAEVIIVTMMDET